MRLFLIIFCTSVARAAVLLPTTQEPTTLADILNTSSSDSNSNNNQDNNRSNNTSSGNNDSSNNSSTESSTTVSGKIDTTTAYAGESNPSAGSNVTVIPLSQSTEPHCKSDETLIEDATSCHVLCSKGALFYYSAGRKPNGTECVINKYLEGTKHIESTEQGDCFKGQCRQRNGTLITTAAPAGTTLSQTTLPPSGPSSSEDPTSSSSSSNGNSNSSSSSSGSSSGSTEASISSTTGYLSSTPQS